MTDVIHHKGEDLARLCRQFGVARLEVFGSVCTPEFEPKRSDVDFLVEFLPGTDLGPWLRRLFEFEHALSELLERRVDLVMTSALRNPWFRREAQKTRTVVYDASEVREVA